jgi:hypothetical protein
LSVLGLSFGFFFLYIKNFRYAYLLRNWFPFLDISTE